MAGDARSGLVRVLKIALPLAALGLAAAVFLIQRSDRGAGLSVSGLGLSPDGGLRLSDPRFSGRTPDGLPFRVVAEWALPDAPDPTRIELGPLTGEVDLRDARRVTVAAGGGEARPKGEQVSLRQGVSVETSDGWRLQVDSAELDVRRESMTGAGPVAGSARGAQIEAGAMRAARRDGSYYIWFEQRVRVRIDPKAARQVEPK